VVSTQRPWVSLHSHDSRKDTDLLQMGQRRYEVGFAGTQRRPERYPLAIITLTDRLEPDLKFCLARRTRSGASPQADEESIERVLGRLKPVQLESSADRQRGPERRLAQLNDAVHRH
jgi:hypothetical protein